MGFFHIFGGIDKYVEFIHIFGGIGKHVEHESIFLFLEVLINVWNSFTFLEVLVNMCMSLFLPVQKIFCPAQWMLRLWDSTIFIPRDQCHI